MAKLINGVMIGKPKRTLGNGRAKLTDADVQEIRRQYATGTISQVELGRRYNVAQGHISEIVLGKQWTHVPKAGT